MASIMNYFEMHPTALQNEEISQLPSQHILAQNYPNPFNPETTISYHIVAVAHAEVDVNLTIYNALGRKICTLVNKSQAIGNYKVRFNASDLAGGIYFYRLKAGNYTQMNKMVLIK